MMTFLQRSVLMVTVAAALVPGLVKTTQAQEELPWQQRNGAASGNAYAAENAYPYNTSTVRPYRPAAQVQNVQQAQQDDAPDPYRARPPVGRYDYGQQPPAAPPQTRYYPPAQPQQQRQIEPYNPPSNQSGQYRQYGSNAPNSYDRYDQRNDRNDAYRGDRYPRDNGPTRMPDGGAGTYSENEVVDAGHRFFGTLSTGLAKAIQWAFKQSGRPNGYILGEDAGGAFVAGLRYGEGKLFTKNYGVHRVFWQGPSIGYDFGGDGNRTMTLVYNLRSPGDVYRRFGGVQGSAYIVGGASVQLLTAGDITLAPIRTGVGLRLGANIGYLKYTRRPTWNPF